MPLPFDAPIATPAAGTRNIFSGSDTKTTSNSLISELSKPSSGGLSSLKPLVTDLEKSNGKKQDDSKPATKANSDLLDDNKKALADYKGAVKSMEGFVPNFEELFGKLDLDDNKKLSREEVKAGLTSPRLNKYEQRMSEIVEEHYKTIEPMGGGLSFRGQKLDKGDMKNLDKMVEKGKSSGLLMNYVRSVAGSDTAVGASLGLTMARVGRMSTDPKGRATIQAIGAALVVGSFVVGGIRGGINYYKAKSEHLEMLREIADIVPEKQK
jgi:hypothetical protein